jgi:hypothetical protein
MSLLKLYYDKKYHNHVPASRFTEALKAVSVPVSGRTGMCSNGCHKEVVPEERLNSQVFQKSFSKACLKKYRESLQLPIIDSTFKF